MVTVADQFIATLATEGVKCIYPKLTIGHFRGDLT